VPATEIGAKLCAHVEQVRLLEATSSTTCRGWPARTGPPTIRVAVNADSVSTWFPQAAALFAAETGAMLDLVLEDEAHTADRLRSGEVLAAVTADPAPVPGCKTYPLGVLDYVAVASPAFMARFFPDGVDADELATAPILRFDRRDDLQARWAREAWGASIRPPTHWTPSTPGMLDMTLAGLGWAMTPVVLAAPHLAAGRLVELPPRLRIGVTLYWQRTRLTARLLDHLTQAPRPRKRRWCGRSSPAFNSPPFPRATWKFFRPRSKAKEARPPSRMGFIGAPAFPGSAAS
jgi:LysR family transcriptional regulator (chromosome initiation inhibitor)